jgi:hypothetical protein
LNIKPREGLPDIGMIVYREDKLPLDVFQDIPKSLEVLSLETPLPVIILAP